MQVKVKKLHPNAVIPSYAKAGDAGLDLTAVSEKWDESINQVTYGTGLSIEIPEGHVGLIYPRSSICKTGLALSNSVGVIDSGYRGEIMFKFNYVGEIASPWTHAVDKPTKIRPVYNIGDRIGQLVIMPYPKVELVESEELSDSERNTGGFGSSGS